MQPVEAFFLTTAEASWLGIAFGAVLAFTASLAAFFLGRRRDHAQRLWERQAELYSEVLVQALQWRHARQGGRPERGPTREDRDQFAMSAVRFVAVGHSGVEARYEDMVNAHWQWVGLRRHLLEAQADSANPASGPEIARYREGEREAREKADSAERELRTSIRQALQRTPTLRGLGHQRH